MTSAPSTRHFLDITGDVCPMTFVRTRLLIERIAAGDIAEVRLKGEEPRSNVPDSVAELGHEIVSLTAEGDGSEPDGAWRLVIRKR